jgi:hypothetical protein
MGRMVAVKAETDGDLTGAKPGIVVVEYGETAVVFNCETFLAGRG